MPKMPLLLLAAAFSANLKSCFKWGLILLRKLNLSHCLTVLLSSAVLAFGLYNVHAVAKVTEGGVLGMILLLEHWLHVSPAISSFAMDAFCYTLGWILIGNQFAFYSVLASGGFSVTYAIVEQFDPLWPQLAEMPLTAALIGAVFVGVGAGMCVRIGGAAGGDDALAMSIAHMAHIKIQWAYLLTDWVVLLLSLSYIPLSRIIYSFLSAFLSGQIIGLLQDIPLPGDRKSVHVRTIKERDAVSAGSDQFFGT